MGKGIVPVFGPYFNGNFGDDLMGHLIARRLDAEGYCPVMWRGPSSSYEKKCWKKESDMSSFIGQAKCVIYGGGLPFSNANHLEVRGDIDKMLDICEKRGVPIVAISVGSHGTHENLHSAAKRLVASPIFVAASLRLKKDVLWLRQMGKQVEFFPDIVLTALQMEQRRSCGQVSKVLLCLGVGAIEKVLLNHTVRRLSRGGVVVKSISQFHDDFPDSGGYYHYKGSRVPNKGPDDMIRAIRESDVVVGSGLHTGIVALSVGIGFISYRGQGKNVCFMKDLHLMNHAITARNWGGKVWSHQEMYSLIRNFHVEHNDRLSKMKDEANGHYSFMLQKLKEYGV